MSATVNNMTGSCVCNHNAAAPLVVGKSFSKGPIEQAMFNNAHASYVGSPSSTPVNKAIGGVTPTI